MKFEVGKRYKIKEIKSKNKGDYGIRRGTCLKKYRNFALFEIEGSISNYLECFSYSENVFSITEIKGEKYVR